MSGIGVLSDNLMWYHMASLTLLCIQGRHLWSFFFFEEKVKNFCGDCYFCAMETPHLCKVLKWFKYFLSFIQKFVLRSLFFTSFEPKYFFFFNSKFSFKNFIFTIFWNGLQSFLTVPRQSSGLRPQLLLHGVLHGGSPQASRQESSQLDRPGLARRDTAGLSQSLCNTFI